MYRERSILNVYRGEEECLFVCAANGTAECGLSGTDVFRDFTFYFVDDEFPSGAAKQTTKSQDKAKTEDGRS